MRKYTQQRLIYQLLLKITGPETDFASDLQAELADRKSRAMQRRRERGRRLYEVEMAGAVVEDGMNDDALDDETEIDDDEVQDVAALYGSERHGRRFLSCFQGDFHDRGVRAGAVSRTPRRL